MRLANPEIAKLRREHTDEMKTEPADQMVHGFMSSAPGSTARSGLAPELRRMPLRESSAKCGKAALSIVTLAGSYRFVEPPYWGCRGLGLVGELTQMPEPEGDDASARVEHGVVAFEWPALRGLLLCSSTISGWQGWSRSSARPRQAHALRPVLWFNTDPRNFS
jgi:hypothetical protein